MALKSKPTQLNGINPLAYIGVNPYTPPGMYSLPRDPTVRDNAGFQIGDFWINSVSNDVWYLAKKSIGGVQNALWLELGVGSLQSLTGNIGGAVFPDVNGNINTLGASGQIIVTGNPGTNTLTWSLDGSVALEFIEDIGSANPSFGSLFVIGTNGITTLGAGNTITIQGQGTGFANSFPTDAGTATPLAGVLNIFGGTAGRDINTSGAGNTVHVDLNNAITLGDLSNITGSAALTCTTGDVVISAGNLTISQGTNSAGTIGIVNYAGDRYISNFGTLNQFIGATSGNLTLTGAQNTGVGRSCLRSLTTGQNNNAFGLTAGLNITSGNNNVLLGQSGVFVTTGDDNTMLGHEAGCNVAGVTGITTGSYNTLVGSSAGDGYTGSESNNIVIGARTPGTAGESNVCRIAAGTGTGTGQINKTFIAGIRGITTVNNNAIAVLIDSAGQLGTVSSSERYKENIQNMGALSEPVMQLRPVVFNYKDDASQSQRFGLIAEEVAETFPYLASIGDDGQPDSVKYHELAAILLNEVQKLSRRVAELENR